jgi:serine/threonine protein kinase
MVLIYYLFKLLENDNLHDVHTLLHTHITIDFGMSGIMQPGLRMNTYCGSPMYMSPEIVNGLGYGPGVDIWSLGVQQLKRKKNENC